MPIVTDAQQTRAFLDILRQRRVAVPCFCTENSWTTEAVLEATKAAGERYGIAEPPVVIAFTAGYPGRSNLDNYWACGDAQLGLLGLLGDLRVLMSPGGPYASCLVFPHLDHGQPDADRWLLEGRLDEFAVIMFDASAMPLERNIARTADYVRRFSDRVVVEGAVDELKEASEAGEAFPLTTPEQAERFLRETGCDLIVPNVGTEHRAADVGKARYRAERARQIAEAVGPNLVLHGTSCMDQAGLGSLPGDGFVKVNIWTGIERTGGRQIAEYAVQNVGNLLDRNRVEQLVAEGLLGEKVTSPEHVREAFGGQIGPHLAHFPLIHLRRRWVHEVAAMLGGYFEVFGYERLGAGG